MNILTLLLFLIGIAYGGLTVLAGSFQLKEKKINFWASLLMIIGGTLTVISIIFNFILEKNTIYLLIAGIALIYAAAINNGYKMYGKINVRHHIIRICISILIITLYIVK